MPETVLQTPFGAVRLIADGGEATPWTETAPKLQRGQRVDACHFAEIRRPAGEAAEIAVVLEWDAPADADIGPDSGELLEATSLDTDDLTATVATRDGEWIEAQPGLRLMEFRGDNNSTLHVIEIAGAAALTFRAAIAWTHNPISEDEAVAPWFAVDAVLP